MPPSSCSACGAPLTVYDRVCDCGALVNAAEIAELRTRARIGQMARDPQMAMGALQRALQRVPEDHPEHQALREELDALLAGTNDPPETPAGVTARRQLIALCAITLGLLLLLVWPLLTGAPRSAPTGAAGQGRHPGRGALYPPP